MRVCVLFGHDLGLINSVHGIGMGPQGVCDHENVSPIGRVCVCVGSDADAARLCTHAHAHAITITVPMLANGPPPPPLVVRHGTTSWTMEEVWPYNYAHIKRTRE